MKTRAKSITKDIAMGCIKNVNSVFRIVAVKFKVLKTLNFYHMYHIWMRKEKTIWHILLKRRQSLPCCQFELIQCFFQNGGFGRVSFLSLTGFDYCLYLQSQGYFKICFTTSSKKARISDIKLMCTSDFSAFK